MAKKEEVYDEQLDDESTYYDTSDEDVSTMPELPDTDMAFKTAYDYVSPDTPDMVDLADIREALDPKGKTIETKEALNRFFYIEKMQRVASQKSKAGYFYIVTVIFVDDNERFTFNLGGSAVLPVLDGLAAYNPERKVVMMLLWNDGGQHDGYYTLQ